MNYDFESLYPQKKFQNKWTTHQDELLEILKRDISHEGVKKLLDVIESLNYNQQTAAMLLGLSCHLHGLKFSVGGSKKNAYKPTIYDTFNSILYLVSLESDLNLDLSDLKKKLSENKLNQQAQIIGFG